MAGGEAEAVQCRAITLVIKTSLQVLCDASGGPTLVEKKVL